MFAAFRSFNSRRTLILAAAAGVAFTSSASSARPDPFSQLPSTVTLTGIVRDFRSRDVGGHADFQRQPTGGFGHYMGMVATALDSEGKPVWATTGRRVTSQWRDSSGRNRINPKSYINGMAGDANGAMSSSQVGAATTAANLAQWFRDTSGVNMSSTLALQLNRETGTNKYVFDDKSHPEYVAAGGFFPVNGQMYGNYASTNKNFHFTYELDTTFQYKQGAGQVFRFIGDDDVWVFVDGKLVIDIGGVHSAVEQTIDLDRLNWLVDGESYGLKFFFAERHTTQSNFRIETTLNLISVDPPSTTALYD
ncbi:MAG: fibro-slime domain-containing protein [Phycisphaerales bacterium]